MSTGIPQIVPHWSAYADWANGYAYSLPVRDYIASYKGVNTIGATPAPESYVEAFHNLYTNKHARNELSRLALSCAKNPAYHWDSISEKFHEVFTAVTEFETMTRGKLLPAS